MEENDVAPTISRLDKGSIHQICSSQVVVDLKGSIKELVDNAIDACATSIEIRLCNNGIDLIEVKDNGTGIEEKDFPQVAIRSATSKIRSFDDIHNSLHSLGFRGEAIGSLCALSDLSIITKREEESMGHFVRYSSMGEIVEHERRIRSTGTTISLRNLFHSVPVRRREFMKNAKTQMTKALTMLQSYALLFPKIALVLNHEAQEGGRPTSLLRTFGGEKTTLKDVIIALFGVKTYAEMEPIELDSSFLAVEIPEDEGSSDKEEAPFEEFELAEAKEKSSRGQAKPSKIQGADWVLAGYISKSIHGRKTREIQHFSINGRPVDCPSLIQKSLDMASVISSRKLYPFYALNLTIATDRIDVNATPDKRFVLVKDEAVIADAIQKWIYRNENTIERTLPDIGEKQTTIFSQVVKKEVRETRPYISNDEDVIGDTTSFLIENYETLSSQNEFSKKRDLLQMKVIQSVPVSQSGWNTEGKKRRVELAQSQVTRQEVLSQSVPEGNGNEESEWWREDGGEGTESVEKSNTSKSQSVQESGVQRRTQEEERERRGEEDGGTNATREEREHKGPLSPSRTVEASPQRTNDIFEDAIDAIMLSQAEQQSPVKREIDPYLSASKHARLKTTTMRFESLEDESVDETMGLFSQVQVLSKKPVLLKKSVSPLSRAAPAPTVHVGQSTTNVTITEISGRRPSELQQDYNSILSFREEEMQEVATQWQAQHRILPAASSQQKSTDGGRYDTLGDEATSSVSKKKRVEENNSLLFDSEDEKANSPERHIIRPRQNAEHLRNQDEYSERGEEMRVRVDPHITVHKHTEKVINEITHEDERCCSHNHAHDEEIEKSTEIEGYEVALPENQHEREVSTDNTPDVHLSTSFSQREYTIASQGPSLSLPRYNTNLTQKMVDTELFLKRLHERVRKYEEKEETFSTQLNDAIEQEVTEDNETAREEDDPLQELNVGMADNHQMKKINKQDIKKLQVIGQFNKGFIIVKKSVWTRARRNESEGRAHARHNEQSIWMGEGNGERRRRDERSAVTEVIYIVDQHAADEKHQFEKLNTSSEMKKQPLISPISLQVSPALEQENPQKNPGGKLSIHCVPYVYSNRSTMSVDDVIELANLLSEEGTNSIVSFYNTKNMASLAISQHQNYQHKMDQLMEKNGLQKKLWKSSGVIRPPRIWTWLASRACRSAIMIGKDLNSQEMSRVIHNLAKLEQPWSCPHGRPTIASVAVLGGDG